MAGPKLKLLRINSLTIPDASWFKNFFKSLRSSCPDMESIEVFSPSWDFPIELNHIMSQQICWNRLRTLDWFQLSLDVDTVAHLSQMRGLSKLSFTLSHASIEQIISPTNPLAFSTLNDLHIISKSIIDVSGLFGRMLLPAAMNISVSFDIIPRHSVKSLSTALARFPWDGLTTLFVKQPALSAPEDVADITLILDDIYPLTALHLTQISIDLDLTIDLRDSSLVEFASSCPQLSILTINVTFGWKAPGITPAGLAQILQACPSLSQLSIALDTHGYVFPLDTQTDYAMVDTKSFPDVIIDVTDSVIEAEPIPALAAFFADQIHRHDVYIYLESWGSHRMCRRVPESEVYEQRWQNVQKLVQEMVPEPVP